jgi:hypothetical protein
MDSAAHSTGAPIVRIVFEIEDAREKQSAIRALPKLLHLEYRSGGKALPRCLHPSRRQALADARRRRADARKRAPATRHADP